MNAPFTINMVCTGNTCRSPIAEVLLRKRLQDEGLYNNVKVLSSGTAAWEGMAASGGAEEAVMKRGASLDGFRSRVLTKELAEESDLIVAMHRSHLEFIEEHYPSCADKVRILGGFLPQNAPLDIPDPIGGDEACFENAARLIDEGITQLIKEWPQVKSRFYDNKELTLAIGCDHRGFQAKEALKQSLEKEGVSYIDCGAYSAHSCDHPDFAFQVSELVSLGKVDRGVLICATGHGMLLSANRVTGVRAILPINTEHAILSRTHNNSNVLAFGADFIAQEEILNIVHAWLKSEYFGGKYQRRVNKISAYERNARR